MKKRTPRTGPTGTGPDLTPVVNIAMVVLVVFMLTVNFFEPERYVQSNLPLKEAGGRADDLPEDFVPPTPLEIQVDMPTADGFVARLGDQRTNSRQELEAMLSARKELFDREQIEDVQVEISPRRDVMWQYVIEVQTAAINAGFEKVTFLPAR